MDCGLDRWNTSESGTGTDRFQVPRRSFPDEWTWAKTKMSKQQHEVEEEIWRGR
jgi:hypothetical protein